MADYNSAYTGAQIDAAAKAALRKALGIAGESAKIIPLDLPNNYLIRDKDDNQDYFVFIPRFNWDATSKFASATPHPAFIGPSGELLNGIYVAKYQASAISGIARSLPNQYPWTSIDYDQAKAACEAKNFSGENKFHLMTNAERAAIALWCLANNSQPAGNNNWGCDVDNKHVSGHLKVPAAYNDHTSEGVWKCGSGGVKTSHDGTPEGIYDLNGNVWEWADGFKLVDGQIYVMSNGLTDAAKTAGNNWLEAESTWIATGAYITASGTFGSRVLSSGADPGYLKALALLPDETEASYKGDYVYITPTGERLPIVGGGWSYASDTGLFALSGGNVRTNAGGSIGFRLAFGDL